jgi:Avidin family
VNHDQVLKSAAAAASTAIDFSGIWYNELGSQADFVIQGSDISGTYTSAVSGSGSPISGIVTGFINGDLIAFSVLWPTAAITSWVGQLNDNSGNEVIQTLWQMTVNVPELEEPTQLWASINAGADNFTRIAP